MNWLARQWEWLKSFFDDDDDERRLDADGHNPTHKNLIGVLLAIVFVVAFLKKVASSEDIPDVPAGWQVVLLVVLGIRSLQAGATAYIKSKNSIPTLEVSPPSKETETAPPAPETP